MSQSCIKPRVVVETCPNPNSRIYHTGFQVSGGTIVSVHPPLRQGSYEWKELHDAGDVAFRLAAGVIEIGGVASLYVKPYELTVVKGPAFDWEDLEPQIIGKLLAAYNQTMETDLSGLEIHSVGCQDYSQSGFDERTETWW